MIEEGSEREIEKKKVKERKEERNKTDAMETAPERRQEFRPLC